MRNLSLIFTAVITLFFASCSKPVENTPGGNTVETKTDLITSGTWRLNVTNFADQLTLKANGQGYRTSKVTITGTPDVKQYNLSWNFANNQQDLVITQTLVKLNGSTNIDPSEAYPETRKYRVVSLTGSNLQLRSYLIDGVSLAPSVSNYTK